MLLNQKFAKVIPLVLHFAENIQVLRRRNTEFLEGVLQVDEWLFEILQKYPDRVAGGMRDVDL